MLRQKLCDICHLVYAMGMVCGSGGNISVRDGQDIWITPSGFALADIQPEDLVRVHMDGSFASQLLPSKETPLHLLAYQVRPDAGAVIHLHSFYSILIGLQADPGTQPMPAYTTAYAAKVGGVGLVPPLRSGSEPLARAAGEQLREHSAVLLQNHGILAVGKDLRGALNLCEDVEFNARIHLTQRGAGALTQAQIESLL